MFIWTSLYRHYRHNMKYLKVNVFSKYDRICILQSCNISTRTEYPCGEIWPVRIVVTIAQDANQTYDICRPRSRPSQWRHNGRDSVSNHQPHDCLLKGLFRRRSKKTWKLRVTGLCAGNLPGTGEFPAQMASNAENVSIWWRHHAICWPCCVVQVPCIYRWHQAITWTSVGLLLIRSLGTNFSEIGIKIKSLTFRSMHFKISLAKRQHFCSDLNVSTL